MLNMESLGIPLKGLLRIQVTWTTGATIGGSSGSPLIDLATGKVVGVLTGGYSNCQDRTQPDYYGRLSVVRRMSLSNLNPTCCIVGMSQVCLPTQVLHYCASALLLNMSLG
jgi:hypothetical protein